MIVTLDGPAGAGKSTAARALAERLGFRFLDTGAMYRAVALAAVQQGLSWNDPAALVALARRVQIELSDRQVLLDGSDVTTQIRRPEITALTKHAAGNAGVREHLSALQRQFAAGGSIVTDGRDQGTVVFPQAECKIYLTASPEERARRRRSELAAGGDAIPVDEVLRQQAERDLSDSTRTIGPLAAADDSITFYTDGLSETEVVDKLEALVRERMK